MRCDQTVGGVKAPALAAKAPSFRPGLEDVDWVKRVEIWFTDAHDDVDFTEFRVFDAFRRRKTVRVARY